MFFKKKNKKPKVRLHMILFIMNCIVILFPIASIHYLRLYENELIRQTESELISQAAFLNAIFKHKLKDILGDYVIANMYGKKLEIESKSNKEEYYKPIKPSIDLAKNTIYPPRPKGRNAEIEPDLYARAIGTEILPLIQEAQKTTLAGLKILDTNGNVIAGRGELWLNFSHVPEIKMAMKGIPTSIIRRRVPDEPKPPLDSISRGNMIDVYFALPIIENNRLLGIAWLSRTPKSLNKALYEKRVDIAITLTIILVIVSLLTFIASLTITRPINKLIDSLKNFSQTGDASAFKSKSVLITRELFVLNENVATMAQTIQDRANYIKDFAMHVSHEFKTPISSIVGTVEILQDHSNNIDKNTLDKLLQVLDTEITRLNKLVNSLLELAKADVAKPNNESCNLNTVISLLTGTYKEKGLNIELELHTDDSDILMSDELLETILQNLLQNSLNNNSQNTTIVSKKVKDKIELIISDDGNGISPTNKDKLFTPFFTTNRQNGGTGLGLSIVTSLLKAHDGSIELLDSDKGASFKLTLPVKAV